MRKQFSFEKYPRENFRRGKVTKKLASDEYFSPTKIFPDEVFPDKVTDKKNRKTGKKLKKNRKNKKKQAQSDPCS